MHLSPGLYNKQVSLIESKNLISLLLIFILAISFTTGILNIILSWSEGSLDIKMSMISAFEEFRSVFIPAWYPVNGCDGMLLLFKMREIKGHDSISPQDIIMSIFSVLIVNDFVKPFKSHIKDKDMVKYAKIFTVVIGICAAFAAITSSSISGLFSKAYAMAGLAESRSNAL